MSKEVLTENKMGVMPMGRLLAGMAVPMMLSMLMQAFYNVVDSIYVARISENALSALSLAFPMQNLCIAVASGTAVGMNALLSRSLGEKRQDMVDASANTGIFLFFISYVVFALIGIFLSRPFFLVQTDVAEIVEYGVQYTSICLGLSVGIFMQLCFERLLQSTGRTTWAMATQMVGAALNIVLDPIFIFGRYGIPAMGVAGAAVATVIGQVVAAILAMIINAKFNPEIHIGFRQIRWRKDVVLEIYRVGLPSMVMQSIGSVMVFGLNFILTAFTTTATAVFGAYFKMQSVVFMPVFGLNNAMVPIISYNYGAAKADRVKKVIVLTVATAITIMVCGMLIFQLFPQVLLGFFQASAAMLEIGIPALRIIATHFVLAGFCIIAVSVCQAIGNPVYALICSVCRQLVVLLPVAKLLSLCGRLELVWLAFPIAEMTSLVMSGVFLGKTMKRANALMAKQKTT